MKPACYIYHCFYECGNSSAGRALPCQGKGRGFESRFPLQFLQALQGSSLFGNVPSVLDLPIRASFKE